MIPRRQAQGLTTALWNLAQRLKRHRGLWLVLQGGFVGLCLWFVGNIVVSRWSQIVAVAWHVRPVLLIASLLLHIAATFYWAICWRGMVLRAGSTVSPTGGVRIYMLSNLAKYIPGSIWGYVGRAYLGRDQGVTAVGVGISVIWEVGITVVASLMLTASALPAYPGRIPAQALQLVTVVAVACLIGLLPPVFNWWARKVKRWHTPLRSASLGWLDFWLFLFLAFCSQLLVGTAFFLFVRSFVDVSLGSWWSIAALWSFSAIAGLIILLAPYGLGVREGLIIVLLQPFMPIEVATAIALASRLWTISSELLGAAIAAVFLRRDGPITPNNP